MKVNELKFEITENICFINGLLEGKVVSTCKFFMSDSVQLEINAKNEITVWCKSFPVSPYKFFFSNKHDAVNGLNNLQKDMFNKISNSLKRYSIETL